MTLQDLVLNWNNAWKFDFWWRQKYNIPFGSETHRSISQIDIKFDYLENLLAKKQQDEMKRLDEGRKKLTETGEWIRENEANQKRQDELFDKIDLDQFN